MSKPSLLFCFVSSGEGSARFQPYEMPWRACLAGLARLGGGGRVSMAWKGMACGVPV